MSDLTRRVYFLKQRLQSNHRDAQALYDLSIHYANGWGVPENDRIAEKLLIGAAKLGYVKACIDIVRDNLDNDLSIAEYFVNIGLNHNPQNHDLMRYQQIVPFKQSMLDRDIKQLQVARTMFTTRAGLEEAIHEQIVPCVVSLVTPNGDIGSGFFQHSQWLVSNAHVSPTPEVLIRTTLVDFAGNKTPIEYGRAFHRPSENHFAPDVVIVEGNVRANRNNKCIPLEFTDDDDCGGRVTFYVYFNHAKQTHEIKYLTPRSKPNAYPMVYECEDGLDPQPGCSGAPVIEARVLAGGHDIQWQFQTVGVVYARHPKNQAKLLCAIPVREEFKQILEDIIHPQQHAQKTAGMAYASAHNIRNGTEQARRYQTDSQAHFQLAERGMQQFTAGKTVLNIDLPPRLEKLLGKDIIGMHQSAFLAEVQKKEDINKLGLPVCTLQDLCADLRGLLNEIAAIANFDLRKAIQSANGNGAINSPGGLFRIDVGGGGTKGAAFVLDIQDNIGYGLYARPRKGRAKEPVSSKFSIVRLQPGVSSISGEDLEKLLHSKLTAESQRFLEQYAPKKKKEVLPLWRIHCKDKGHAPWVSEEFNGQAAALAALETSAHARHAAMVVPGFR